MSDAIRPEEADDEQHLFVAPASGREAARHVVDSVANPISKVKPSDFFPEDFLQRAREVDSGHYYAWGARPGKRNTPYWSDLKRGDYVLFYQNKRYTYVANVLATADNEAFATALWSITDEGDAWRHVYFLTQPTKIDVPIERVSDYLQDAAYQGFTKITRAKMQAVLADYGSLEDFVSARFVNNAEVVTRYFILRRNIDSKWDDKDSTYHFGSNVPNLEETYDGKPRYF